MLWWPSLALTGAVALTLFARPAAAQSPGYYGPPLTYPTYPLGINPSKAGSQAQQQLYRSVRAAAVAANDPAPPRPAPAPVSIDTNVVVSVSEPAAGPVLVNLKGPNGDVRSFHVAGGKEAIHVRTFIIRPGESVTLTFQPSARQPRKDLLQ